MFRWRRIRREVNGLYQICGVYRRATERPHMAGALDPLHAPPRPWHIVGLDFLTHLLVRAGFDSVLVVVDHLTRMAIFFLLHRSLLRKQSKMFYKVCTVSMAFRVF
jgi:hypothetical protein